jgi:intein/homing endonuclease
MPRKCVLTETGKFFEVIYSFKVRKATNKGQKLEKEFREYIEKNYKNASFREALAISVFYDI